MDNLLQFYNECNNVICTDTRKIISDSFFFALKGSNFDGNRYAHDALKKGAKYAVIDNSDYLLDHRTILVEDTLKALQQLAHDYRKSFNIPVLGITGSNGKTTAKELITGVLSKKFKVHSTPGNFNNHIGLPLTLLSMPVDTEFCVLEMGDNHMGEIALLAKIGAPTHGLVTNVGKDHIEGFGSFENNRLAKKELFDYLANHNGIAFLPSFEQEVVSLANQNDQKVSFGQTADEYYLKFKGASPFISYTDQNGSIEYQTRLIGEYNFKNIEMAHAIGAFFNVDLKKIHNAIADYSPKNLRSEYIEKADNIIFLDAYNSNPSSLRAALDSFDKQQLKPHRTVILGDMLELGDQSLAEHQEVLSYIETKGYQAFFVGSEFAQTKSTKDNKFFVDRFELIKYLNNHSLSEHQILIKGSRGIRLEEVLEHL